MLTVARLNDLIGEIAEVLGAAQSGFRHKAPGLAGVPAFAKRDFLGAGLDGLGDVQQDLPPLGRGHVAPKRKGGGGGIGGGVDVGIGAARDVGDMAFVDGRVCLEHSARAWLINPANPVQHAGLAKPGQVCIKLFQVRVQGCHRVILQAIVPRRMRGISLLSN